MKMSVMRVIVVYSILWIIFCLSVSAQSSKDSITRKAPISQIECDSFFVKDIILITSKDIPSSDDYYLIVLLDNNNLEYCLLSSYKNNNRERILVGKRYFFLLYPHFKINSFPGTYYFEVTTHKHQFKVASQMRFMNVYLSPNLNGLSYNEHPDKLRIMKCEEMSFRIIPRFGLP